MSFVSSKGNIFCRLIKIELYKIFAIINRAIKGLHCIVRSLRGLTQYGRFGVCEVYVTQLKGGCQQ